ncbi:MAG: hypothetical protein M1824_002261 [Vezdaea acicularis]|nr:MAG: hypothetical protein M1824_002261 [Vezdaea acicularis]
MADAISILETNKIRVSLGLKPLPVPGESPTFKEVPPPQNGTIEEEKSSTLESRQAEGYDNWNKLRQEEEAKLEREAKNERIKKARDAAKRFSKLEGKSLGESSKDNDLDTMAWLKQKSKREKRILKAKKMEEELAERERPVEYNAEDLAGVTVTHEINNFLEGGDRVLTLKDTTIEENEVEGDELENLELKEEEKLFEKLELKRKKPVYNPNDAVETGERKILSQYDVEIDGKERKQFVLDDHGRNTEEEEKAKKSIGEGLKKQAISLDFLNDEPRSDYLDPSEVKIRKPKKRKSRATRQKVTDDDDIFPNPEISTTNVEAMNVDHGASENGTSLKRRVADTSFADDDSLQSFLALQRRSALKKRRTTVQEQMEIDEELSTPEEGGLVIDETSEFIQNLQKPTKPQPRRPKVEHTSSSAAIFPQLDNDVNMEQLPDEQKGEQDNDTTGLEAEATFEGAGIGNLVGLLNRRGIVGAAGSDNRKDRQRDALVAELNRHKAKCEERTRRQRVRDRDNPMFKHMSAHERERHAQQENEKRDKLESQEREAIMRKYYKPNVELHYTKDGRELNLKEAFKDLSHQFHGREPGKQKTEKGMKKNEEQDRKEAKSLFDTSQTTGMNSAMSVTAKKTQQAGIRLQ